VTLKKVPSEITSGPGWSWQGAPFNYVCIDDDRAVLDGLDVDGCFYLPTDLGVTGATIKRSRVTCGSDYTFRYADNNAAVALNLVDVELVGGAVQVKGNGFSMLRVNAHAFTGKAAMLGSGSRVEDSYVHDPVCVPPDHQSGIGTNGGTTDMVMLHNNIDLPPNDCISGGVSNYTDFGSFSNVLLEKNLINSGGYCLKAGIPAAGSLTVTNERIVDNVFGRKYFPECGYFGPVSNWLNINGNTWSGNTWGDGAAATNTHVTGSPVIP
jgi:hypothetical protein